MRKFAHLIGFVTISLSAAAYAQEPPHALTPAESEVLSVCGRTTSAALTEALSNALAQSSDVEYFDGDGTTHILHHEVDRHAQVYESAKVLLREHSRLAVTSAEILGFASSKTVSTARCNIAIAYNFAGLRMLEDKSDLGSVNVQWPVRGTIQLDYTVEYGQAVPVVTTVNFVSGGYRANSQDIYGEFLRRYAANFMAPLSEANRVAVANLARANDGVQQANVVSAQAAADLAALQQARADELARQQRQIEWDRLVRAINIAQRKEACESQGGTWILDSGPAHCVFFVSR